MLKVFMYGSCVSRDTYDFFSRDNCKLLGYVSRQSIISTFNAADPKVLESANMTSPFQMKNSLGDFQGDLLERLDAEGKEADVIVWDLIDERNGVVSTAPGGYVTFTYDLYRANVFTIMEERDALGQRIKFGSDEHFALWKESVDRFLNELEHRGLKGRVIVLVAPWAEETDRGTIPNIWHLGPSSAEANVMYERYYRYLRTTHDIAQVRLPVEDAVTAHDHKWGPAPYHYTEGAYSVFRSGIEKFADKLSHITNTQ